MLPLIRLAVLMLLRILAVVLVRFHAHIGTPDLGLLIDQYLLG